MISFNILIVAILFSIMTGIINYTMAIVANLFLIKHNERPLKYVWSNVKLMIPYSMLIMFVFLLKSPPLVNSLLLIIVYGFFSLFLYLDYASRCLPKCFTVIFISIGLLANCLLYPECFLYTFLYLVVTFLFLHALRFIFTYVSGSESMGKGDIYLISGLTVWFDYTIAIEIVLASSVFGALILIIKKYQNPLQWNKQYSYRTVPFAPFVSVISMLYSSYLIGV